MEYQTSSTSMTLSQKLSTGHSIYDGVFTSAAPSSNFTFSSSFDDYREIFGTANSSSSIPVLQVPELNERKASVDVRSSKLDYSNVFCGGGGDGGSDFALPYEELFAEPKKRTKLMHKETRIQIERVSPTKMKKAKSKSKSSCSVESVDLPNESAFESYDGVKKFKMSYNRTNHRSKSFAGVHTVPAYTCSMDETSPSCSTNGDKKKPVTVLLVAKERAVEGGNSPAKAVTRDLGDGDVKVEDNANWKSSIDELFNLNKPAPAFSSQVLCDGDKPVSLVTNDASNVDGFERNNEASHHRQASRDQQSADASKQTFGGVPKAQNSSKWRSSGSIDKFFYSGEIVQESRPSNMPPFLRMPSEGKSEVEKSVASMFGVSNADIFRGDDTVASPPYFDEEVDSNSVAAASVAALTKAIEEAQASIRMAKELMDRKKVGVQSRVKLSFDDSTKPELSKRNKLAERASMSKKTKTRELYDKADVPAHVFVQPEQVTPVFENVIISSDVMMVLKEEMHEEKFADNGRIFKEVETRELHEEVDVALEVSTGPEQVSVAIEEADLKETRGKVHDEEFRPTPTDHRLEEVDDSEASEQFYEFADTGEEVVSEAVEQFFEFADSSEPDVSEAADEFYEFSDSSEHHELKLENEEVNSTRQTFPLVDDDDDDDDEQHKKTDMEDLDKPEQDSKSLEATTVEHREVETIFNVVRGISDFREHANELASSKEDSGQDDDDEKRQEELREHEESGKLEATHINETSEEKQNGDDENFESQELYETEHVKINLVTQEWVENEKTGMDACMQKDDGREQTEDAHREEDIERSLNKDSDEVTIETVNDFCDKEDSDKRLDDDSEPDGHGNLQDIKLNEMILEEATYQKKESENSQEESFDVVDNGRGQTDAHSEEDTERSLNKDSDEVITETVNDFYDKEDIDKRLEDGSKSDGHDNLQDIKLDEMILEEASYQKKESENSQESFEVVDVGRMQILTDESTKDEKVKATQEDQKNLACEIETGENLYEQGAKEDLYNKQGSAGHVGYEQDVEETLEVLIKEDDGGVIEVAETLIELEENEQPLEMVEEKNDMREKEICEPDGSTPSIKLPEMPKEREEPTEIHSLHENEINASRNDTSFVQRHDDQLPSKPLECNLGRPVEEFEESGDIDNDVMGAEVSVDQDSHKNSSKSRKRWFDSNEVSETFIKLEEDGNQSESVEEEDVIEEKEICEIEGLASGVKLAEILKQMEDVIDIPSCDTDGPSTFRNAMNSGQNQDEQLAGEPEVECKLGKHVEELEDMNKGSVEPEVAVSPEQINSSKSSHRKRWFDNGNETTAAQAPPIFAIHSLRRNLEQENYGHPETTDHTSQEMGRESRANLTAKESGTNYTLQREVEPEKKENQQQAQTGKEFEVSATLQKELEREKEHRTQKAAKRREREMQREQKKAVEQVMREARQRSFAEAQRAAEIRQKAEAQRRLGKTSVQANDTSLAEKASEEAKQKSERAYVERATQEARDRALEKALSEKIASEAGKQAKRSVSEKSSGVSPDGKQAKRSVSEKLSGSSRDNGVNSSFDLDSKVSLSTSRSSSSLTHCDPSVANGESAQRCKAKLERNQRTAERAAKALAEKNNRDLLVQHEQAERNRLAEVLDAEVKRWSSGKERNLRALLSTLQYILGPDSGWQPVPLTDIVTAVAVKKAYRKAALCVHPDKLQQRGASIQQKYTCEKVFDLLKEAWNRFSAEER